MRVTKMTKWLHGDRGETGRMMGTAVVGTVVLFAVVILVAHALPSRMPPDPFDEDEEPREVYLEVTWQGDPRGQLIAWDAGDDEGEVRAEAGDHRVAGERAWAWLHVTTAAPGVTVRVTAVQDGPGPVQCAIYVDDERLGWHPTQDRFGCLAEVTVPPPVSVP